MKPAFVPRSEKTRQFIIEQAARVFNKQGYAGTSLSHLTNATKLTKGSIYGNFANKNEVALEAFKYNAALLGRRIGAYVGKVAGPLAMLFAITKFYREDFNVMVDFGGCPLLNAATDSDDTNEQLRVEVAKAFNNTLGMIKGLIERGIAAKEIVPGIDAKRYAVLFLSLIEGGILLSKTMRNKQHLLETCDRIDRIITDELQR